jgi:succinate dehydrogenase / fumarate reductase membrane anchor subunit
MEEPRTRAFRYAGRGGSGAFAWMMQRLSGLALIILTVGHYLMMHYKPASGHTWDAVASRLSDPIFVGLYAAFLILAMYHGVQGIWNIIRDFKLKPVVSMSIFGFLLVVSLIFLGIGLNTVFTFNPHAGEQPATAAVAGH